METSSSTGKNPAEQDPFAIDRSFSALYDGLEAFTPPVGDRRFQVSSYKQSNGAVKNINVISGNGKNSLSTIVHIEDDTRTVHFSVKKAPPSGRMTIAAAMARADATITLSPVWDGPNDRSILMVDVARGENFGEAERAFIQEVGLGQVCPPEYIEGLDPGGDVRYLIEDPNVLAGLADAPTKAAELPQAA